MEVDDRDDKFENNSESECEEEEDIYKSQAKYESMDSEEDVETKDESLRNE